MMLLYLLCSFGSIPKVSHRFPLILNAASITWHRRDINHIEVFTLLVLSHRNISYCNFSLSTEYSNNDFHTNPWFLSTNVSIALQSKAQRDVHGSVI
jgi:hypothetical protein